MQLVGQAVVLAVIMITIRVRMNVLVLIVSKLTRISSALTPRQGVVSVGIVGAVIRQVGVLVVIVRV